MAKSITRQVAELRVMTIPELQAKYREVFGEETFSHHKRHLWRKIAWRIQELAEGGLSERAGARARELANEADVRAQPPREKAGALGELDGGRAGAVRARLGLRDPRLPVQGSILERDYKGRVIEVCVLDKGFEYEGKTYRSLSAVAFEVTGARWNGFHFFGLNGKRGER